MPDLPTCSFCGGRLPDHPHFDEARGDTRDHDHTEDRFVLEQGDLTDDQKDDALRSKYRMSGAPFVYKREAS